MFLFFKKSRLEILLCGVLETCSKLFLFFVCQRSINLNYPWSWRSFDWLLVAHFLHGCIVLLLVISHKHFQRASCVNKTNSMKIGEYSKNENTKMLKFVYHRLLLFTLIWADLEVKPPTDTGNDSVHQSNRLKNVNLSCFEVSTRNTIAFCYMLTVFLHHRAGAIRQPFWTRLFLSKKMQCYWTVNGGMNYLQHFWNNWLTEIQQQIFKLLCWVLWRLD